VAQAVRQSGVGALCYALEGVSGQAEQSGGGALVCSGPELEAEIPQATLPDDIRATAATSVDRDRGVVPKGRDRDADLAEFVVTR
jgi:hypothetical protein